MPMETAFIEPQPSQARGTVSLDAPPAPILKQDLHKLGNPPGNDQPLFASWSIAAIAANGGVQTFNTDAGIPEFWIVQTRPIANTNVRVYAGPGQSGQPVAVLGGGGRVKIKGTSEFITVINIGAVAIDGVAVATRHFEYDVTPGSV